MRYGPSFFGNLKNLVSGVHGAKHSGSAAGPLTISGSASAVELSMTSAVAASAPPISDLIIVFLPMRSQSFSRQFLSAVSRPLGRSSASRHSMLLDLPPLVKR